MRFCCPQGEDGRATGRPGYPALTLFRALLLGQVYRLSDVQLEQGLTRGFLFRKVCHLEPGRGVPDATTLGRFRTGLGDRIEGLFGEVVRALSAQNLILAEGRIASVDVEGPPAMGSRAAGGGSRRQGAGCARATLRRVSM